MRRAWLWHRKLAYLAGIAAILWAASGVLHPLMTFTAEKPVTFKPPLVLGDPGPVLAPADLPVTEPVSRVRLMSLAERPVYQLTVPSGPDRLYYDARTGVLIEGAEEQHIRALAAHYTGWTGAAEITQITDFSLSYPTVSRFLPAWSLRFEEPEGRIVAVETERDRVVRLSNDTRQVLLSAFQIVHTLPFLPDILRVPVITILVGSTFFLACFGALILLKQKKHRPGIYRWHRALAWIVLLPLLAYPVSGLLHLWVYANKPNIQTVAAKPTPFQVQDLKVAPPRFEAHTVVLNDTLYWRLPQGQWLDANGIKTALEDTQVARQLYQAPDSASVKKVARFTGEYGFANRVLPVWRVAHADKVAFIDVKSAQVVTEVTDMTRLELWTFNHLHKWRFVREAIGGGWVAGAIRDGIQILLTSLIVILAGLGLWMR